MRVALFALLMACSAPTQAPSAPPAPVPVDPWPRAQAFVWSDFLHQKNSYPEVIFSGPDDFNIWDWVVYIDPSEPPASSFLCEGYMFAALTLGPSNWEFEISDLDLSDPLRWGPYLGLCQEELRST